MAENPVEKGPDHDDKGEPKGTDKKPVVTTQTPQDKKKEATRNRIIIGCSIVGLILAYLMLSRGSSSSSGGTTTSPSAADSADTSGGGYDYAAPTTGSYSEDYGGGYGADIMQELASLQNSVAAIPTSAASASASGTTKSLNLGILNDYKAEKKVGSGYNAGGQGGVVSKTNNLYNFVSNYTKGASTKGLYVQTSEGHFVQASKVKNLAVGTPTYKFTQKV